MISKSKYMRGEQCLKALWLSVNKPETADDTSNISTQQGNAVGECARHYFSDSVTIQLDKTFRMVEATNAAMRAGAKHICEATFANEEMKLSCSCDIIVVNEDGSLDVMEVKSSTSIKDRQLDDVCFQSFVVSTAGFEIRNVYLLHPNSDYFYETEFDVRSYFSLENVTDIVRAKMPFVKEHILRDIELSAGEEPMCELGMHCEKPHECEFKCYCHQLHCVPEQSVFSIPGMTVSKKYNLYQAGLVSLCDLTGSKSKNALTEKQKELVTDLSLAPGESIIKTKELRKFLDGIHYPIYYLDFESFQEAVPPFPHTHPYEQIPFQYSLHIQQYKGGPLEHKEFLAEAGKDPRRALAEQLVRDIPVGAHAMAYNASFERTVCRKLAERFPDLVGGLLSIAENLDDLLIPFRQKWVYTSSMRGSCSIKAVLPALCGGDPALDYHALPGVQNGAQASATFSALATKTDDAEVKEIRRGLLLYCGLDTLAMVKVLEKLYEFAK